MDKRLILIVDDNKINRKVLGKILENDYRLIEAANGQEALNILEDRTGEVSAILLDLSMPIMDGFEFLKIRQKSKKLLNIPIIVQTQKEGVDSEIRCLKDGASDFLTKPYNPSLLKHRLENIIKLRENESFILAVQHDSLTGLYNTEGFYIRAAQTINQNPEKTYSIICGDINQFKIISQIYGEVVGDETLIYVAKILKLVLGKSALIARFSADRFQALIDYKIDSVEMSEKIDSLIHKSEIANVLKLQLGVYTMDRNRESSIRTMCDYSRMPIESIKGKYGKTIAFYNQTDYEKLVTTQKIVSQMEQALIDKQFVIYYQPKVKVESGEFIGAEALVRWINPDMGFMNPGLFIPLFETNGFITKLDKYVWEEVCKSLRRSIDAGYNVVPVSVNISRNDFYSDNLVDVFVNLINKYNIDPSLLHLEITETAYTQGQEKLVTVIKELSSLGFYIEMDDFGSGYSSLNMLAEVSVDMLKLDMTFMINMAKSNSKKSIIHLIMGIAKELELDVITEGIETEADVNYLKKIGCKYAQGYYYSRPIPEIDYINLLTLGSKICNLKVNHLCFSPNGSTLIVGSFVANKFGKEKLVNVTSTFKRHYETIIEEGEILVLSYPTYYGRVPKIFREYLMEKTTLKGVKVILVATFGNQGFEDSLVEGEDIVNSLGGSVIGAIAVVCKNCCVPLIAHKHPDKKDFLLIDQFAKKVLIRLNDRSFHVNIKGNRPYKDYEPHIKPFYMPEVKKNICVECNDCVDVCPSRAMRYNDPKLCIHCCACINNCSTKALFFNDTRFLKTTDYLMKNCIEEKNTIFF